MEIPNQTWPMEKSSYNENFGGGLYGRHHVQRFRWLSKNIASIFPERSSISVLEVGCYDGKTLEFVPVDVHRYVGFDAGWGGGLDLARRRFATRGNYKFHQSVEPSDIANTPGHFDLIICMETFEHISPSKVGSYISAFAEKLEGFLLVTVPNEQGLPLLVKTVGAKLLGKSRDSYDASEFANAFLGRMEYVPRSDHKGFDYTALAKSLGGSFQHVKVEGVSPTKFPPQLSLTIGMIASHTLLPPAHAVASVGIDGQSMSKKGVARGQ
jgi:2-polyprenyl-3-methyl-5-hydroxy-6-metoxy-1,4-benzoquinol methylase